MPPSFNDFDRLRAVLAVIQRDYLHPAVVRDVMCFVGVQSCLMGCVMSLVHRYLKDVVIPARLAIPSWDTVRKTTWEHMEIPRDEEDRREIAYHLYVARRNFLVVLATYQYVLSQPDELRISTEAPPTTQDPSPLEDWFRDGASKLQSELEGIFNGLSEVTTKARPLTCEEEAWCDSQNRSLQQAMHLALDATYRQRTYIAPTPRLQRRTLGLPSENSIRMLVDVMGPPHPGLQAKKNTEARRVLKKSLELFEPYVYSVQQDDDDAAKAFRYIGELIQADPSFSISPTADLLLSVICGSQGRGILKSDVTAKLEACATANGIAMVRNAVPMAIITLLETLEILESVDVYNFETSSLDTYLFLKILSPRGTWPRPDVDGVIRSHTNICHLQSRLSGDAFADGPTLEALDRGREEAAKYFSVHRRPKATRSGNDGRYLTFLKNVNLDQFCALESTPWAGAEQLASNLSHNDSCQQITLGKLVAVAINQKKCVAQHASVVASSHISQPLSAVEYLAVLLDQQREDRDVLGDAAPALVPTDRIGGDRPRQRLGIYYAMTKPHLEDANGAHIEMVEPVAFDGSLTAGQKSCLSVSPPTKKAGVQEGAGAASSASWTTCVSSSGDRAIVAAAAYYTSCLTQGMQTIQFKPTTVVPSLVRLNSAPTIQVVFGHPCVLSFDGMGDVASTILHLSNAYRLDTRLTMRPPFAPKTHAADRYREWCLEHGGSAADFVNGLMKPLEAAVEGGSVDAFVCKELCRMGLVSSVTELFFPPTPSGRVGSPIVIPSSTAPFSPWASRMPARMLTFALVSAAMSAFERAKQRASEAVAVAVMDARQKRDETSTCRWTSAVIRGSLNKGEKVPTVAISDDLSSVCSLFSEFNYRMVPTVSTDIPNLSVHLTNRAVKLVKRVIYQLGTALSCCRIMVLPTSNLLRVIGESGLVAKQHKAEEDEVVGEAEDAAEEDSDDALLLGITLEDDDDDVASSVDASDNEEDDGGKKSLTKKKPSGKKAKQIKKASSSSKPVSEPTIQWRLPHNNFTAPFGYIALGVDDPVLTFLMARMREVYLASIANTLPKEGLFRPLGVESLTPSGVVQSTGRDKEPAIRLQPGFVKLEEPAAATAVAAVAMPSSQRKLEPLSQWMKRFSWPVDLNIHIEGISLTTIDTFLHMLEAKAVGKEGKLAFVLVRSVSAIAIAAKSLFKVATLLTTPYSENSPTSQPSPIDGVTPRSHFTLTFGTTTSTDKIEIPRYALPILVRYSFRKPSGHVVGVVAPQCQVTYRHVVHSATTSDEEPPLLKECPWLKRSLESISMPREVDGHDHACLCEFTQQELDDTFQPAPKRQTETTTKKGRGPSSRKKKRHASDTSSSSDSDASTSTSDDENNLNEEERTAAEDRSLWTKFGTSDFQKVSRAVDIQNGRRRWKQFLRGRQTTPQLGEAVQKLSVDAIFVSERRLTKLQVQSGTYWRQRNGLAQSPIQRMLRLHLELFRVALTTVPTHFELKRVHLVKVPMSDAPEVRSVVKPEAIFSVLLPAVSMSLNDFISAMSLSAFCVSCGLSSELSPRLVHSSARPIDWGTSLSSIQDTDLKEHCLSEARRCLLPLLAQLAQRRVLTCNPPIANDELKPVANPAELTEADNHRVYLHCTIPVDPASFDWQALRQVYRISATQASVGGWAEGLKRLQDDAGSLFCTIVPHITTFGWESLMQSFLAVAQINREVLNLLGLSEDVSASVPPFPQQVSILETAAPLLSESIIASGIFKYWQTSDPLHLKPTEPSRQSGRLTKMRALHQIRENFHKRAVLATRDVVVDPAKQATIKALRANLVQWQREPTNVPVHVRNLAAAISPSTLSLLTGAALDWDQSVFASAWGGVKAALVGEPLAAVSPNAAPPPLDVEAAKTLVTELNAATLRQFPTAEQLMLLSKLIRVSLDDLVNVFYIDGATRLPGAALLDCPTQGETVRRPTSVSVGSLLWSLTAPGGRSSMPRREQQTLIGGKRQRASADDPEDLPIVSEWLSLMASAHLRTSRLRDAMHGSFDGSLVEHLSQVVHRAQRNLRVTHSLVKDAQKILYFQNIASTTFYTAPVEETPTEIFCSFRKYSTASLVASVVRVNLVDPTNSARSATNTRSIVDALRDVSNLVPLSTALYLLLNCSDSVLSMRQSAVRISLDAVPLFGVIVRAACLTDIPTENAAFISQLLWNYSAQAARQLGPVEPSNDEGSISTVIHNSFGWCAAVQGALRVVSPVISSRTTLPALRHTLLPSLEPSLAPSIGNVVAGTSWESRVEAAAEYLRMVCLSDSFHLDLSSSINEFSARFSPQEQLAALVAVRHLFYLRGMPLTKPALSAAFDDKPHTPLDIPILRTATWNMKTTLPSVCPRVYSPDFFVAPQAIGGLSTSAEHIKRALATLTQLDETSTEHNRLRQLLNVTCASGQASLQVAHALFGSIMQSDVGEVPPSVLVIADSRFKTFDASRGRIGGGDDESNSDGEEETNKAKQVSIPLVAVQVDGLREPTLPHATTPYCPDVNSSNQKAENVDESQLYPLWQLKTKTVVDSPLLRKLPARDLLKQVPVHSQWLTSIPAEAQEPPTPTNTVPPSGGRQIEKQLPTGRSEMVDFLAAKWGLAQGEGDRLGGNSLISGGYPHYLSNPFLPGCLEDLPEGSPFVSIFHHQDGTFNQFVLQSVTAAVFDTILMRPGITMEELTMSILSLNDPESVNFSGIADVGGSGLVEFSRYVPQIFSHTQVSSPMALHAPHRGTILTHKHVDWICRLLEKLQFVRRVPISEGTRQRYELKKSAASQLHSPTARMATNGGDEIDCILEAADIRERRIEKENGRLVDFLSGRDISKENFQTLLEGDAVQTAKWVSKMNTITTFCEASPFARTKPANTRVRGQKSSRVGDDDANSNSGNSLRPRNQAFPDRFYLLPTYDAALRQSYLATALAGLRTDYFGTPLSPHPSFELFVPPQRAGN